MKTLYTCLTTENSSPFDIHLTHKFIGKIEEKTMEEIVKVIDHHFTLSPFKSFNALFNKEQWFGVNNDMRVLVPEVKLVIPEQLFILRAKLDPFRADDYPTWNPHVTTLLPEVSGPWSRFIIVYDKKILKEYQGS